MKDLVKIELPFSGFYESVHDNNIDDAIERGFDYNYETDESQDVPDEIWEADIDYTAIRQEYCKNYVEAFGDRFGLTLTFDELTSPREYNFSSDRIFVLIPREEIDKIRKEVEAHAGWPEFVNENFSSRSGFWSFYSNDYKDEVWTRETLDECQYEKLILFWLENISDDVSPEGWYANEYYLTEDSEIYNWDSIIAAHEAIEKYLKEKQ